MDLPEYKPSSSTVPVNDNSGEAGVTTFQYVNKQRREGIRAQADTVDRREDPIQKLSVDSPIHIRTDSEANVLTI